MNDIDPRIIEYYDGSLSPEETTAFLSELNDNDVLKREWEFYGQVIEGIKSEGAIELKEYIKEHIENDALETQSNLWMYAAASVAFLLLSYFAIYSYLETGNIKDAAAIITLKDKKSDKFKFWQRNKQRQRKGAYLDSVAQYNDSALALETSRNSDSLLPTDAFANADYELDESYSPNDESEETQMGTKPSAAMGSSPNQAILLTQATVIPIKLNLEYTEGERDKETSTKKPTSSVLKNKRVQESISSPKKRNDNTSKTSETDSNTAVSKPAVTKNTAISKFKLIHFEDQRGTISATLNRVGNEINLSLYNLWGENPLIYDIEGAYYIDFGADRIWKIPEKPGAYTDIKWVKNATIINRIRN
jgi:hypothetical protein